MSERPAPSWMDDVHKRLVMDTKNDIDDTERRLYRAQQAVLHYKAKLQRQKEMLAELQK